MNLSIAEIGAGCVVLFGVFHWLKIFATIRTILAFVGVCLLAASATGALGFDLVLKLVTLIESLLSDLTQWLIGARVGALLLVLVLGAFVVYNLHPKNSTHKHTGIAGIALALVLLAGVAQIPALSKIPADVRTGVTNARTSIQSGQGR